MVFIGTNNTIKIRGVPGIALNYSNRWGGHLLIYLYTGNKLHSYEWEELPIDN